MIVKIIFGLGIIIWEVFRVQMSKFTLLESPLSITGHKAGKNDTMTVGFFKVMDQPEPGLHGGPGRTPQGGVDDAQGPGA